MFGDENGSENDHAGKDTETMTKEGSDAVVAYQTAYFTYLTALPAGGDVNMTSAVSTSFFPLQPSCLEAPARRDNVNETRCNTNRPTSTCTATTPEFA